MQLDMGIKSNKTDNPALPLDARRKTFFDFDQKIQATIKASVGDRLNFDMSYNTDATFDFDSKNIALKYEGKEDADVGDEQFEINDDRSFTSMYQDMEKGGLQPVLNDYIYV